MKKQIALLFKIANAWHIDGPCTPFGGFKTARQARAWVKKNAPSYQVRRAHDCDTDTD